MDNLNYTFSQNLARLMELNGLTNEKLGEELGLGRITIEQWLAGKKLPNAGSLQKIQDYFGVDATQLFRRQQVQ